MSITTETHAETIRDAGPVSVTVSPAAPVAGGPDRPAMLRIEWAGGHLSLCSTYTDDITTANAMLIEVADLLPDRLRVSAAAAHAFHQRDVAVSARRDAEARLVNTLTGRAGIAAFGDILVRVADDGSAWLLDPVKREAGFGLRLPSLDAVWHNHPELRPVKWGADAEGPFLVVRRFAMNPGT